MRVPLPASLLRIPIAHRALHDRSKGRIENSPSAIRAAVAAGYAIEIDVQLSSDGQAMVFHDEELLRLTGREGWVKDHTAAALGQITLTDSTDTIPTLPQVLETIAGRVPLLIEIKDQTLTMSNSDGRLEQAVAKALEGYKGDVALMSFNPHSIAQMAALAPNIPRGLTTSSYDYEDWHPLAPATCDNLRDIPDYDRTGSSFISHQGNDLTRPRVTDLKSQGAAMLCWTIRSLEQEAMARQVAQNITFECYAAAIPA
jgi:glycerophosphoryl diester phosphodiesterase